MTHKLFSEILDSGIRSGLLRRLSRFLRQRRGGGLAEAAGAVRGAAVGGFGIRGRRSAFERVAGVLIARIDFHAAEVTLISPFEVREGEVVERMGFFGGHA